ncbi:uncharacterized protein LOC125557119 [Nematostella vectensis]|uniref:uncharacterized protein LOC125557119 n=1 Tax=Nematostella vectensis TaxID=45351 RepID=UPI0020773C23|nr:uncharacterized protein LOC125557119 [Nematostella vectensis]
MSMCGADCWTDHRLILPKINFRIQSPRRPQEKKTPKRLDTTKLQSESIKRKLWEELDNKLEHIHFTNNNVEEYWASLRDCIYQTSSEHLGPTRRKHQDWFDENCGEIQVLLEKKHLPHKAYLSDKTSQSKGDAYKAIRRTVQAKLRQMKDSWTPPVLSADGKTLLTDKEKILSCWAEHFENILNRPSSINEAAIACLPQVPIKSSLASPITDEEVTKTTSALLNGKAPGADAIPAEIYKNCGPTLTLKLAELFNLMLQEGKLPQELKDALLVHIYKRLLNHLETGLLPESQCGYRKGRMIFAARQLQQKCKEHHQDLYTTFVDLSKAFDTVSRAGLWKIMSKYGCPEKFITLVRAFHNGMQPSETAISAIPIHYRTDGKLFKLSRRKAKSEVKEALVHDMLFADDCALNASSEHEMQHSMDHFSSACDAFGLTISIRKQK